MPAPTISSTTPTNGQTNVFINSKITIVFSTAIDSTTITNNTVRLTHQATNNRIWCDFSISADGLTVVATPRQVFGKDESYTLTLLGINTGLSFYIKSATSDALALTSTVIFTTGNDIEAWSAEKNDETVEREGDLSLPADLEVVSGMRLVITETSPINHSAGIPLSLSQITATFNAELDSDTFSQDWMTVTVRPMMSYDEYLAKDRGDGTIVFAIDEPEFNGDEVSFELPSGSVELTGETLIWTRDDTVDFPYNCEVEVSFDANITDIYGNTLMEERKFIFTLEAFPMFSGVDAVQRELAGMPEEIERDHIHAAVWYNSIKAWQISGKASPALKAYHYYRQYAHAGACLQLLENAELPKTIMAGQRKVLGDFAVSFDANAVGKEGLKYKRLKAELEEAIEALEHNSTTVAAIKGSLVDKPIWRDRTWKQTAQFNTSNYPGAPITEPGTVATTRKSRESSLPGEEDQWS